MWQQKENKVDHEWRVRTWDEGVCAVGVFECLECQCCLSRPDSGENKAIVQNVFINYRNKHIGCEKHVTNWRRRRNLPLNVGENKTPEPQVNRHAETDAACAIVEKKQVRASSVKKEFGAQLARASLFREASRECRVPVVLDKPCVGNLFSIENCEKEPGDVHSDLSLLCWGFWFTSAVYGGKVYDVKPLLDDQKRDCIWGRSGDSSQGRDSGEAYNEVYNPKFALNIQRFTEDLLQGRIPIDCELGRVLSLCIWSAKWEARHDMLIGFYGDKDNHVCKMGLEVEVGSSESSYSKIEESFEQKIKGSYARVVIVNPLHEKLPRLIVYSFIVSWVRDHWKGLKQRWDKCCRQAMGPVMGHASDGDARRRKLMLEDYFGSEGQRWTVGWDRWVLFGIVLDYGDVYAFGDQDPIHNGKKMINPLDKSSYPIVLGDYHACLEHVQLVYKLYSHDHHGLNIDDVMIQDRQNWTGMRGYERNYDFGDLLDCASGLNRLALLEYGEEVVKLPKTHVKQRPLWAKLHPLPPGHAKLNLSDFARLAIDDKITKALKVGLQQAQTLLTQLNMSPHAGEVEKMPKSELSFDLWDIPEATGAPSTMEADMDAERDESNDLEVYGHEARHVLFNWYSPIAGSRVKFTYDNIDLQWIDLESVITIVSLKMERSVRVLWILDSNGKGRATEPWRAFFRVFQLDADARSALRSPVGGEVNKGEEVTWRYRAVKFKTQVVGQFGTS
ncbi:hypothetical protein R1flu_010412 [Riccia fluitans]|uniref:Uncharacterized protein n=1 Tax=Riccia fluitans TaxID=41844 RepID=A0ABD1Z4X1_9MARC